MHILFISRGYPSKHRPQNGNFEVDQAEGLAKSGHTVSMISVDLGREFCAADLGFHRVEKNGVLSYNMYFMPMRFFAQKGVFKYLLNKQLDFMYKKVERELGKPDIIYAHYLWNADWALYLKYKYHIPVVGIEHWSEIGYEEIKPGIERNARRIYPQLDGLITVSHALQNNIKKWFGIESDVVFNTIHDFVRMNNAKKLNDGIVRFISVGTILPVKGYDNLITAFARCSLPRNKWALTIVGEGPEELNLRKLTAQYELEKNICFAGKKSKAEVVEMLNNSDVFISSSHLETFGVAALEAICCGVPVLSTDSGGPREFITEHNGRLCDDNVDALKEGIEYMYVHYAEFDKKRMSEDAVKRFSSTAIAQQLETIFKEKISKAVKN